MLVFVEVLLLPEAEAHAVSLPHIHSGSSASGGGCYTVKKTGTKYETETLQCKPTQGSTGLCAHTCPQCGYTFDSRVSISCGASYQKSNPVSYTYYEANCGQTTGGSVQITSSTSEPAQSVTLSCEATSEGSGCSITGYSWSNGGGSSSISVSENGTYTCTVSYQDSGSGGIGKLYDLKRATRHSHTLEDVVKLYRENAYLSNPKTSKIVSDIANECKRQELKQRKKTVSIDEKLVVMKLRMIYEKAVLSHHVSWYLT